MCSRVWLPIRSLALRLFVVFCLLGAVGCAKTVKAPKARVLGGLLIDGEPQSAEVYVDERFFGTVAGLQKKGLSLAPGLHRIEVRKDGYFSSFLEVKVVRGVRSKVAVRLRKEPF
jgi:hypothetical protein